MSEHRSTMSRKIRVLWLTKGLGRGGAEALLVGCARHLDRERYEVDAAYVLPWKDLLVADLEAEGVRVHCLGSGGSRDVRWVWRLRELMARRRYDIVHTHMPIPAVAARMLPVRPEPVLVHTEHNLWSRYRTPTRWANALTYGRNTQVIAVSNAVSAEVDHRRLRSAGSLTVVHHGVDRLQGPVSRAAARERLGLAGDAFVVGSVGNLTAKKDQRTLVEALGLLRATRPDARLVLIGTGPLEAELRAQVRTAGLDDAVVMTGSRGDVRDLLAGFDAFALSSRQEGLPVAIMEAMAAGLPIVATAVGGLPEMIEDGRDGLLVPPGSPAALSAALARIAADPGLAARLGSAAEIRSADFDAAAAQRRIEAIYERALATRDTRHAEREVVVA